MKKLNIDLNAAESRVMKGLKDFQRATVDRIVEVFENGQNRVLVADEVGLGKTLIARGVIAKTALVHHHDRDRLFKVVYVCSNQSIADQNLNKLRISQEVTQQSVNTSRLSMQHLNIFMQEHDDAILGGYIQLIPLTPDTSFRLTSGAGSVDERALMYAILRRIPEFQSHLRQLRILMIDWAPTAWENWAESWYERKVLECEEKSNGRYLQYMLKEVSAALKRERVMPLLEKQLEQIQKNANHRVPSNDLLGKLRLIFSKISLKRLEPDLVIMDEFQRFKFLINADETTDTGLLARKFLSSNKVKTLLLSATPYKLYSTLEEIDENQVDEHYSEFFDVMNFLYDNKERSAEFKNVWNDYSVKLRELDLGDTAILEAKNNSEQALYGAVCRTERITAVKSGDFIDDSSVKRKHQVKESDIRSYIQAQTLLELAFPGQSFPLDYIKSCPYVMSFMKDYQVKKRLEAYFRKNPDEVKAANKDLLWIKRATLNAYKPLEAGHLRLNLLKENAFCNKSERLLWVPPSKPYYEPRGVFKYAGDFSKILVFSSWEMVPRMISSLISYEAECRSVGSLTAKANKEDLKNANYFAKRRYPGPRLRFSVSDGSPKGMNLFALIYPSEFLASCFDPIQFMNEASENSSLRLKDLEKSIRLKISEKLDSVRLPRSESRLEDDRWYYMAPLLLDQKDYVLNWIINNKNKDEAYESENDEDRGQKGYFTHLDPLLEQYSEDEFYTFGKQPADLLDVLTTMALASPAVCAYRMLKQYETTRLASTQGVMPSNPEAVWATHIAKMLMDRFNSPEATSIVELCYEKSKDAHWQNVLSYCKDGNLQSVLDEFAHILIESNGLIHSGRKSYHLHNLMLESIKVRSSSYNIDTYNAFQGRVSGKKEDRPVSMRTHFAVAFAKGDGHTDKDADRRKSVRTSFNSPFRPFVLATTSIGQEGLDFHYYCRKIMHWNLPSNPIDLEQREGRINRYKCHSIRQNVAKGYGNIKFKDDIWAEMFENAKANEKGTGDSDLIPFWCLSKNQDIKIERIIPMYPLSRDISSYQRLIKILSLYRLTLGQPRQEELLEYIFTNCNDEEKLKELFINLSPFFKE